MYSRRFVKGRNGLYHIGSNITPDPPPGVALDRVVDWVTATGFTLAAVGDGGKLFDINHGTEGKWVVQANPFNLGFPDRMKNISGISYNNAVGLSVGNSTWMPSLAIGDEDWIRMYDRVDIPDGVNIGGFDHGWQSNIGFLQWVEGISSGASGLHSRRWGNTVSGEVEYTCNNIPKYVCYRVLINRRRVDANNMEFLPYYFNDAISISEPEFGPADFSRSVGQTLANNVFPINDANAAFRSILLGSSGSFGSTYSAGIRYHGGLAHSIEGPIGPYPIIGSEEETNAYPP